MIDMQALAARLPPEVYTACTPHPQREGANRVAALTCSTPIPGADELLVTQWPDPLSLAANFGKSYGGKPSKKCGTYDGSPRLGRRSTWGAPPAPLACYVNSQDAAIILWHYPDHALEVLAVRRDRNAKALFRWWSTASESFRPKAEAVQQQ